MAFDALRSDRTRIVHWLDIDGIQQQWHSGPTAPSGIASPRAARGGLLAVSPVTSRVPLKDAVIAQSQCSVTLARLRDSEADTLLRLSPDGATRFVTLSSTVAQSITAGPFSVVVNEDISAWPASGVLYIGQEAMLYASKDNATKTFTVNNVGRGYYGSEVQQHYADAGEGWQPRIYSEPVAWRGRRARVWAEHQFPDGSLSGEPVCVLDGFISGLPQRQGDDRIEIGLVSMAKALDREVGAEELTTGLQYGYHAFDGFTNHALNTISQAWGAGDAFNDYVRAGSAIGTAVINDTTWETHQDVFDYTLTTGPRRGDVVAQGVRYEVDHAVIPYVGNGRDGTGDLNLASNITATISTGNRLRNAEVADTPFASGLTAEGTEEVVGWPAQWLNRVFSTLNPGTNKGAGGLWADVLYDTRADGSPVLRFRLNSSLQPGPLQIVTLDATEATCSGFCIGDELPYIAGGRRVSPGWRRPVLRLTAGDDRDAPPGELEMGLGMPAAWYGNGEKYLHVADDVFTTPSAASPIYVEAVTHTRDGEERFRTYKIVGKAAASTITAGAKGTVLEVAEDWRTRVGPLHDWPGQPATKLRQVVQWDNAGVPGLMLQLLLSGQGNGFNDATYDVLPFGCNLTVDQVDRGSFQRFTPPTRAASRRSFKLGEELSIKDLLADLAKSIGAVLTERLDPASGRRKLALVPAGIPSKLDSVQSVADGDWAVGERPRSIVDGELVNALVLTCNYGFEGDADKPGLTVNVNDRDSIQEHRKQGEEMELRGVTVRASSPAAQRAALLPLALERFGAFGHPRRLLSGALSFGTSLLLDPGAVVQVTASDGHGYDGTRGVTAACGRVQSITRDPLGARSRVEVVLWGVNATGWAPSMQATGISSATALTVSPNAYTESTDPLTGLSQADSDFFAAGQSVVLEPAGDWSGAVTRTIQSIAGGVVTFTAAHGFVAGDLPIYIQPEAWDSAATAHQQYAYLADDDKGLGAAPDAGYQYA